MRALFAFVAAAAIGPGASALAAPVILPPSIYKLHDHPDGELGPPGYGLRLDELVNVGSGTDHFTFSFDNALSDMKVEITSLTQTTFKIDIFGTAFGGRVVNHGYDPNWSGVAQIDFTYLVSHLALPDDDLIVTTPTGT